MYLYGIYYDDIINMHIKAFMIQETNYIISFTNDPTVY